MNSPEIFARTFVYSAVICAAVWWWVVKFVMEVM